ncbi:MAG: hypothetical protein V2J12_09030 [Gammaproteobacteria bacterium]|nr:hypothetical protein [Gammaproteobacteria bacterium]
MIAFVGSVFSTYYSIARALGRGDPLNHCSVNVSMWHAGKYHWAFTERGRDSLHRSSDALVVGPSSLSWDGTALTIELNELSWPRMGRLRGRLKVYPSAITSRSVLLDTTSWHRWWPIAPKARIEVEFDNPATRWSGDAYVDHNAGQGPLEKSFSSWNWSRAHLRDETAIFYDLERRDQEPLSVALSATSDGELRELDTPPPCAELPATLWRLNRMTRADAETQPEVLRVMEDGPFYARSLLRTRLKGEAATVMQETLSLKRLAQVWIRYLVLYRNPRALRTAPPR